MTSSRSLSLMSELQVLHFSELFIAEAQLTTALTQRWRDTHTSDTRESLVPSYFFPLTSKNIRWDLLVWHLANGKVRGECVTACGKVWRAHHTHKHTPLHSLLWSTSLKFPLRQNSIWPNGFTLQLIVSVGQLPAWWPISWFLNFTICFFLFFYMIHLMHVIIYNHIMTLSTHRMYWFWQFFLPFLLLCHHDVYVHLQTYIR